MKKSALAVAVVLSLLAVTSLAFAENADMPSKATSEFCKALPSGSDSVTADKQVVQVAQVAPGTYWASMCFFPYTGYACSLAVPMLNGYACCCAGYGCGGVSR